MQDTQRAVNDVNRTLKPDNSWLFWDIMVPKIYLAKHLNALLLPTEGNLWVDGIDTSKEPELWESPDRKRMVFQNPDNQIIGTVVEEGSRFPGPENMGVPTEKNLGASR